MISQILILYSIHVTSRYQLIKELRPISEIVARDTGVSLRFRYVASRRIPRIAVNSRYLIATYKPLTARFKNRRVIVIAPPQLAYNRYPISAEQAAICGNVGVVSFTRSWMDRAALLHGIGHLLGATHTADATIMNPSPAEILRKFSDGARYSESSANEIFNCVSK